MELSYLNIAIKLIMGLLSSVLVINISGKGNLAPSSTMDQVSNYVLGGIVGRVIYAPNITVLQFFIVLMIWTIIVLLLKWLKTNSIIFKSILDGQPVILIKKGVLDVEACRKAKITASEVAFKLRREGIYYVRDVKRAVFEQNGELIIVLKDEENPKYPIITDGIIQSSVLDDIGKTEEWLMAELQRAGYHSASEIFLAEYEKGQLKLVPYSQEKKDK